ncbi:MAG TPA: peptidyl-prolyl cis-trans isomerase [bacterium]|nr:peptidyl-prolyl cis-trans isomerase [bacterium]
MIKRSASVLFPVLVLFSGCAGRKDTILKVGREKVTVSDFKENMTSIPIYYQGFLATEGGRRQYVDGLMKELVLVEMARKRGLEKNKDVQSKLEQARRRIMLEAVIDDLRTKELAVSEEEIKGYYDQNQEQYLHPLKVRASHILAGTKEEAEKVLRQLKEGASFSKLVKEHSMDTVTVDKEGDLGFFSKGEMVPEFEDAVFAMKELGEISGVIQSPFGFHVAKLTGRDKAAAKTFEEAKSDIERNLRQKKLEQLIQFYKKKFAVRISYDLVSKITPPWMKNVGADAQKQADLEEKVKANLDIKKKLEGIKLLKKGSGGGKEESK